MDQNLPLTPVEIQTKSDPESLGRSLKKIILLNVFTLGFYSYYWLFLNWKNFQGKAWPDNSSPFLKTLGALIPLVGIFFVYGQFKQIQKHAYLEVDYVPDVSPGLLAFCWYLQLPLSRVLSKIVGLTAPLPLLAGLVVSTFVMVTFQRLLNAYWLQTQPDLPLQNSFSTDEKAAITIGVFVWLFLLLFILLPG